MQRRLSAIIVFTVLLVNVPGTAALRAVEEHVREESPEQEVNELGEGRKWIPSLSFPPSDPDSVEGELYFWDRNVSLDFAGTNLYLSKKRGLEFTVADTDFYLRIGGRIFVDFVKYFEDKNELGDDGIGLRNFMIEMNGRLNKHWLYRLSWGGFTSGGRFDGSGAYLDDAYVSYNGFEKIALVFGQHSEPFGLEEMSTSLASTFMEKALPNGLVTGTNVGASFNTYWSWWGINAGLFAEDLASGKDISNQGYGLTGRIHCNPGSGAGKVLHLGTSFSARDISGTDSFFFRRRPEAGLTDVRYLDTGDITNTENVFRYNIEAAVTAGPLSLQAEYIGARITRETGYGDLDFDGWYVFGSWFVTGGSRNYYKHEGLFGYPATASKRGELELAVRYSMLDLSDRLVRGGEETNLTLGINWYLSHHMRLMVNYVIVDNDIFANANGTLQGNDDPRILQIRFQYRI